MRKILEIIKYNLGRMDSVYNDEYSRFKESGDKRCENIVLDNMENLSKAKRFINNINLHKIEFYTKEFEQLIRKFNRYLEKSKNVKSGQDIFKCWEGMKNFKEEVKEFV